MVRPRAVQRCAVPPVPVPADRHSRVSEPRTTPRPAPSALEDVCANRSLCSGFEPRGCSMIRAPARMLLRRPGTRSRIEPEACLVLAGTLLYGPAPGPGSPRSASPRSSGDRAPPSGGGSAGSNPAGGADISPSERLMILRSPAPRAICGSPRPELALPRAPIRPGSGAFWGIADPALLGLAGEQGVETRCSVRGRRTHLGRGGRETGLRRPARRSRCIGSRLSADAGADDHSSVAGKFECQRGVGGSPQVPRKSSVRQRGMLG